MLKKKYTKYLTVALEPETYQAIRAISDERSESMGNITRELLTEGIERRVQTRPSICEEENYEFRIQ